MVNVLIADNNIHFARCLMNSMNEKNENIRVCGIAKDGMETLEIVNSNKKLDVILLDFKMPICNVDEILSKIIDRDRYKKSCIIMSEEYEVARKFYNNDIVYKVLYKSLDMTDIIENINKLICYKDNGDGTVSIYTRLGNNGTYLYGLDISSASNADYANVQIWNINFSDAQKFTISETNYATFVIFTKVSNNSKAIVLNGPTCDQGRNVDQYTFQGHVNEAWILEPVNKQTSLGVEYATTNAYNHISAYPDNSSIGGDCANFVSQCMLASGIHYQNDWNVYRKNDNYSKPTSIEQLNNTWELADPSPWISAKYFSRYWKSHSTYHYYKGSEITANPSLAWNLDITTGDVVQIANNTLGILGDAQHTMYITGYSNSTYLLTYHTTDTKSKSLLDLCASYPNSYFVFYEI